MTTHEKYDEDPETSGLAMEQAREAEQDEASLHQSVQDNENDDDPGYFRPQVEWFEETLWRLCDDDVKPYALIDGEWCSGLYGRLLNFGPTWAGLWQGNLAAQRMQDAPFVVALERGHKFTRWLIEKRWGMGCVVYLTASTRALASRYARTHQTVHEASGGMATSRDAFIEKVPVSESENAPIQLLRRHFRRFTAVEFESDGRFVDFRFYDPAVLRTYLMSCNADELAAFFGPVKSFLMEHYSPVESLNRPEEAFLFRFLPETERDDQGNTLDYAPHLAVHLADFIAREYLPFTPPPMPTEQPGRKTAGHVLIRDGQMKAFEKAQGEEFIEGTADNIVKLGIAQKRLGLTDAQIRSTVRAAIFAAQGYNIYTKSNLHAYSICAVMHGHEFFRELPGLCTLIENPHRKNGDQFLLKKMLLTMSDIIVGKMET